MKSLRRFVEANFDTMTSEERRIWLSSWTTVRIVTALCLTIILIIGMSLYYNYLVPEPPISCHAQLEEQEASYEAKLQERDIDMEKELFHCESKVKEIKHAVERYAP